MSTVVGVHRSAGHTFSKTTEPSVLLVAGQGIDGDVHAGATVKHRSRDGVSPNLRQVHLMTAELLAELDVPPGELGENVTTAGVDLLALPRGTRLRLGPEAVVEVTGLRNPCKQIDRYRPGLLKKVLLRDSSGAVVRRAGVMSVVVTGGPVRAGDAIVVELPEQREPLEVV